MAILKKNAPPKTKVITCVGCGKTYRKKLTGWGDDQCGQCFWAPSTQTTKGESNVNGK